MWLVTQGILLHKRANNFQRCVSPPAVEGSYSGLQKVCFNAYSIRCVWSKMKSEEMRRFLLEGSSKFQVLEECVSMFVPFVVWWSKIMRALMDMTTPTVSIGFPIVTGINWSRMKQTYNMCFGSMAVFWKLPKISVISMGIFPGN